MKKSVKPDPDKTLKIRLESQPLIGENAPLKYFIKRMAESDIRPAKTCRGYAGQAGRCCEPDFERRIRTCRGCAGQAEGDLSVGRRNSYRSGQQGCAGQTEGDLMG